MKRRLVALSFVGMAAAALYAFEGFAKLTTVEPDTGKAGDTVAAKGENLDKGKVGELYLTDGKNDVKAEITGQTETEIKFKIPKASAGRYRLMLLSANKASMIEQPVVLTVE